MSSMACEIIGTGDGKIKNISKNEGILSKTIAKDIVLEIIDNALDIVDDTSDVTIQSIMDQIPIEKLKGKIIEGKDKSLTPLKGTGDQKSNVSLETPETVSYHHPPVEKKNRLTDLVKNSKQLLAKIIYSDSKSVLHEDKKEEEKIVEVIELDCVQISDLPFKSKQQKVLPEDIPLPENDSLDLITPPEEEESMDEVRLSPQEQKKEPVKKTMTFPRAGGSRAKAAFAAKCRTLKMGASNLKKKKWDVSGKIANFFKKKRPSKEGAICEENTKHVDGDELEEASN